MKDTTIDKALQFMKEKHEGQIRIGGDEYHTHPLRVATMLKGKGLDVDVQITGLFHDLLEDTDATEDEIKLFGGEHGEDILQAVKLLTKDKGYDMETYINGIEGNPMAHIVKLADRLHNLQCAKVTNDKFKKKYITETEKWYLELAKGTAFDTDIRIALKELKEIIN